MIQPLSNPSDPANSPAFDVPADLALAGELFQKHWMRLEKMVRLRMDRRLRSRVDPSDVLQDTWLDCERRFAEYSANPAMPFFHWLRFLTAQRLVDLHRKHLGAAMRDAGQEVLLYAGALPTASSVSLAEQLIGRLTSASHVAYRAEIQIRIQEALNSMEAVDREILALRHFEMLTNEETAHTLGLRKNAASNRYIRALKRLRQILEQFPGLQ
ncbi:MAG TPA: sigma-70 family RNA polymerase sigma factor [Planctomycetaceae bacterium]|nr:sigma-70 family RNA polymerase sigma factor [Planctomycetaceae bacterium]HQZ67019.1 sigma-70 family RNA polymerase sigma factor [Planctomycetaceae bacterium]